MSSNNTRFNVHATYCTTEEGALKARRINKKLKRYERAKANAIQINEGKKPTYTLGDRYHNFWTRCRRRICQYFARTCMLSPDNRCQHFWIKLKMDGTFENYIGKSILGFFGGMILTYVFFIVFVIQMQFSIAAATLWCTFFGIILTLGLAFSQTIRVVVFLLLPQFFSKRGRQALMAYAFVLALTGPAKNALRNTEIMSESLACGQEQIKQAVRQIIDAIKKPFIAIKEAFRKVMKFIKQVVEKIKSILIAIKRITLNILKVIKSVFQWLGSIVNICNKKVGTPFQRCQRAFEGAVADCQAKMGPLFDWLCSIAYVTSIVCYVVKILDFVCMFLDFINDSIIGVVKRKIKEFMKHIQNIFYVSVEFKHSYNFETRQNVSMKEIAAGILTEIRTRTDWFLACFDIMSLAFSCMFLLLLFKVIQYRWKFLTSDKFDNHFITSDFRDIDLRRAKNNLETLLPLNRRERNQYIKAKSVRLVKAEKMKLVKSAMFLGATVYKLFIILAADYCLYWVLDLIHTHGRLQTSVQAPKVPEINVQGEGILADLYRSVDKAFKPFGVRMEIDTVTCLPEPIPPDYIRYLQIGSTVVLCLVLALLEPYGLRLRHIVMCYYYPDRSKQRAVWLYNHILRTRGTFLKYARRQLRRNFGKNKDGAIEIVTIMDRIRALCPLLNLILGKSKQETCLLCGKVSREEKEQHLIKCPTPNCPGQFCTSCYADLMNVCPICKKPIEYGDLSDESLEHDSSEDENQGQKKPFQDKNFESNHQNDNRTSSETSYSYQDDVDNDPNINKPPLETRPPFRDVESQVRHQPVTTQIFNVTLNSSSQEEEVEEIYKCPKKMRMKHKLRKRELQYKSSTIIKLMTTRRQRMGEETQKLLGNGDNNSSSDISISSQETDSESSDYASMSSYDAQEYTCSSEDLLLEIPITRDQLHTRSQPYVTQRSVHTVTKPKSQPIFMMPQSTEKQTIRLRKCETEFKTEVSPKPNKNFQSQPDKGMKSTFSNVESISEINIDVMQQQSKRSCNPDGSESNNHRSRGVQWINEDHQMSSEQTLGEAGTTSSQQDQLSGSGSESPVSSWKSYRRVSNMSDSLTSESTSEKDVTSSTSGKRGSEYELASKETSTSTSERANTSTSQKDKSSSTAANQRSSTLENEQSPQHGNNIAQERYVSKSLKPKSRWTQSDGLEDERSLVRLLGSNHDDSDNESSSWSEMSTDPMPSEEEMEQYRAKFESRVKKKKIQVSLRSHIVKTLKKLMNWNEEQKANRHQKMIQDTNSSVAEPSQKDITKIDDIIDVGSVPSNEVKIKNNRTSPVSVEVEVEHDYEDEDIYDIEETEKKPLISSNSSDNARNRNITIETSSVDSLYIDDNSSTVTDDISSEILSSDLLLHPLSQVSISTSPFHMQQQSEITPNLSTIIQEISQGGQIKETTSHKDGETEQSSECSKNFNDKPQNASNIEDKSTRNLLRQSPVPGERPLYGFDTLSYQGHTSYFSLINELEDELKRRNMKKVMQPAKTPPDLIQSGVRNQEENSETNTRSRPSSSYDFRVGPSLCLLPPDIVPRQSKHSMFSHKYPVPHKTHMEIPHLIQTQKQNQHITLSSQYDLLKSSDQMTHPNFRNENRQESSSSQFDSRMFYNIPKDNTRYWQQSSSNLHGIQKTKLSNSPVTCEQPLSSTYLHIQEESQHHQHTSSNFQRNFLISKPYLTEKKYQTEITSEHLTMQDEAQTKHLFQTDRATPSSSFTNRPSEHMGQYKICNFPPHLRDRQEMIHSTRHEFVKHESGQDIPRILDETNLSQFNKKFTQYEFNQEIAIQQNRSSSESVLPISSTSSVEGQTHKSQELFLKRKSRREQAPERSSTKYYHHIGTISEEDEGEDTKEEKDK